MQILSNHICRLLLVNEYDDGRRKLVGVKDLKHALPAGAISGCHFRCKMKMHSLLLFVSADKLNPLLHCVDRPTGLTNRNNGGLLQVLLS